VTYSVTAGWLSGRGINESDWEDFLRLWYAEPGIETKKSLGGIPTEPTFKPKPTIVHDRYISPEDISTDLNLKEFEALMFQSQIPLMSFLDGKYVSNTDDPSLLDVDWIRRFNQGVRPILKMQSKQRAITQSNDTSYLMV